jgi:hypothetical protein
MTAVARKQGVVSTPLPIPAADIFRERCEARAILVNACVYDLQDAVDGLQADAERTGLVDELGQDAVQRMMAEAFAIVPKDVSTNSTKTVNKIDTRDVADNPPKGGGKSATRLGAPPTTVEAVMYSLRQRGPAALAESDCRRRLSDLSPDQLRQVIVRLDRMRAEYPAITDGLLLRIGEKIA